MFYSAVRSGVDPSAVGDELLIVDNDGELTSATAEHVRRLRKQGQLLPRRRCQNKRSPPRLRHPEITRLSKVHQLTQNTI